jgi:hypothetical protein
MNNPNYDIVRGGAMMRKFLPLLLIGLMTGAGVISASAAEPDAFNPMKAVLEMQKNIAWTVDGLDQLGKTSDRTLKLTSGLPLPMIS